MFSDYTAAISLSVVFSNVAPHACVPSTASKVWYRNRPIAQLAYIQGGQSWSSVGLYHSNVRKLTITKPNPERVTWQMSLADGRSLTLHDLRH